MHTNSPGRFGGPGCLSVSIKFHQNFAAALIVPGAPGRRGRGGRPAAAQRLGRLPAGAARPAAARAGPGLCPAGLPLLYPAPCPGASEACLSAGHKNLNGRKKARAASAARAVRMPGDRLRFVCGCTAGQKAEKAAFRLTGPRPAHPPPRAWARRDPGFRPDNTARCRFPSGRYGLPARGSPAPPRCAGAGGCARPGPAAS